MKTLKQLYEELDDLENRLVKATLNFIDSCPLGYSELRKAQKRLKLLHKTVVSLETQIDHHHQTHPIFPPVNLLQS